MNNAVPLYKSIIEITDDYLGPASERFIERHIQSHLGKKPTELKTSDINKLIIWLQPAFSILTDDTDLIDEYISRLKSVAEN